MKKNILFLCSNMDIGGFQKSLVSLLQYFDYEKYNVDLLLLNPTGIFMDLIPNQVNVLSTLIAPEYFASGKDAVISMIRKGKFGKALIRLISCVFWMFDKGIGASIMIKGVPRIKKHYDVAIDYNGQHLLYYMVDKVNASKKISYFHSDYGKWSYYKKMDRKYYKFVDAIITVSQDCVDSMKNIFPEYTEKIYCIENIISDKTVNLFPINSNVFSNHTNRIKIVTVGRVCKNKGFDFACHALHKLLNDDFDVVWYMVGPVEDKAYCDELIRKYNLYEKMIFFGKTNNPYDCMRYADIIVHPSRFEGKAVAVEEAKILNKPIVATKYSTVNDQIIDGETGLIVDMDGLAVYEGIKRLIEDKKLRDYIVERQKKLCCGNESEIKKLYKIMEDI